MGDQTRRRRRQLGLLSQLAVNDPNLLVGIVRMPLIQVTDHMQVVPIRQVDR